MLNIPEEVKALFSSDTVHKNFHVHFPDGETSDLNNEDIVSESVSFTESLCSQQYFKFGLAEASQLEFTAVGIPNVRGAVIEAAMEIDCTRLGAAWAEQNPSDDTLPFLTPQTCVYAGKTYYRVPYGRFVVDTCPRDHGAMWQRVVTAYTSGMERNSLTNDFEVEKERLFGTSRTYNPSAKALVLSVVCQSNPDQLLNYGYTKEAVTITKDTSGYSILVYIRNRFRTADYKDFNIDLGTYEKRSRQFTVTKTDLVLVDNYPTTEAGYRQLLTAMVDEFVEDYCKPTMDLQASGLTSWDEVTDIIVGEIYDHASSECAARIYGGPPIAESAQLFPYQYIDFGESPELIYPFQDGFSDPWLLFLGGVTFSAWTYSIQSGTQYVVYNQDYDVDPPSAWKYAIATPEAIDEVALSFNSTLQKKINNRAYWSFSNAFSFPDVLEGYLEICGWFLKAGRTGTLEFFQMSSNPVAIAIPRNNWMEIWWDETPIQAIGQVNVIFTEDGEEQQQTVSIGNGNSVYIVENNEMLKAAQLTEDEVSALLNTYFAPNANAVDFTPADIEMKGLPYLESGDYLQFTSEDGTVVETYVLSQTINGIQHLTTSITSTNGELLEVIDDE